MKQITKLLENVEETHTALESDSYKVTYGQLKAFIKDFQPPSSDRIGIIASPCIATALFYFSLLFHKKRSCIDRSKRPSFKNRAKTKRTWN